MDIKSVVWWWILLFANGIFIIVDMIEEQIFWMTWLNIAAVILCIYMLAEHRECSCRKDGT